jgi:hypothetical protein
VSRRWKSVLTIGGGVAVLVAGGVLLALWARYDPLRAEYPDSPFTRLPADDPFTVLAEEEPPPEDAKARADYHEKWVSAFHRLYNRVTPEEWEAMGGAFSGQFVRARDLSLALLKKNPHSAAARLALVTVENGEGNLPRALLQVRNLRQFLYRQGLENPKDEVARDWFFLALRLEPSILQALSRSEEQLRAIDVLEQICRPMPELRAWPLIKLRRFSEARRVLQQAETSGRMSDELLGCRVLLAREAGLRKEQYDLGLQAVTARPDKGRLWAEFTNAALDDFRSQEAYDAAMKAAGLASSYAGGYATLCNCYIHQGRIVEAWDALKKFQEQRRLRPPFTLQYDADQLESTAASLLLLLGRCDAAARFARRRVEKPHRLGLLSADSRDDALGGDILLLDVLSNRLEELREEAASAAAGQGAAAESAALQWECWTLEKRVVRMLGDEDYLLKCLRPPRMQHVLPWLPGRVAREALRRAREKEKHPSAAPYFDAMEAELAWIEGHDEDALALARKALAGLPGEFEKELRAKVAVVAGQSAWRLGQNEEMRSWFDEALRDCPAVFRMYRVALPVRLSDDGSPLAQALGRRLLASPRFREDAAGFSIALRTTGNELRFDLSRLQSVRHCAGFVTTEGKPSDVVAAAYRHFHRRLISPQLDLRPIDINFLEDCPFAVPPGDRIDATIGLLETR